jgi:hypothetical protein
MDAEGEPKAYVLTPVELSMDRCAKMLLAAIPGETLFLQGSYPLAQLHTISRVDKPSAWEPKDLDFFVSGISLTHFGKLLAHLRRDLPIVGHRTTKNQHRFCVSYGGLVVPVDLTRLVGRTRTRHQMREAADISLAKVQIVRGTSDILDPKTLGKAKDEAVLSWGTNAYLTCPVKVFTDICHGKFDWHRASPPSTFASSLFPRASSVDFPRPHSYESYDHEKKMEMMRFPSDLTALFYDVWPEQCGPDFQPRRLDSTRGFFLRSYRPHTVGDGDGQIKKTDLEPSGLMAGTVYLCPAPAGVSHEGAKLSYYLDDLNRVWVSDDWTMCSPGLHPDDPRASIRLLDLLAFLKSQSKDMVFSRHYPHPLFPGVANVPPFHFFSAISREDLVMQCDHCELEITDQPAWRSKDGEFDLCQRCFDEENGGPLTYRERHDHKTEDELMKHRRRYWGSLARRVKYEDRGYTLATHYRDNPPDENLEYNT